MELGGRGPRAGGVSLEGEMSGGLAVPGFSRAPVFLESDSVLSGRAFLSWGLGPERDGGRVKRLKSIWWMPWHREAMKDVARCDKPWGVASAL